MRGIQDSVVGSDDQRSDHDEDGKTVMVDGDLNYEEWYNKYVKGYGEPTGKGDWSTDKSGKIVPTKEIPAGIHYRTSLKGESNGVVQYKTNGNKQTNYDLYDENGFIAKQVHLGNHGNAKRHNLGTVETPIYEHVHEWTLDKDGKLKPNKGCAITSEGRNRLK